MEIPIKALLHRRTLQIASSQAEMSLKEKRPLCAEVRKALEADVTNPNRLLPSCGATVGEICVIQVLSQDSKKNFKEQIQELQKM